MISRFTLEEFKDAIRRLGILKDACLLTTTSFYQLGSLVGEYDRNSYHEVLGNALLDTVGPEATLVANAYTSQVGRYGVPFVWEGTETTAGLFSKWMLCQPERARSLHPLQSMVGIGPLAGRICDVVSKMNYGVGTPIDRMLDLEQAFILRIGIEPYFNAFTHHSEATVGVPYFYVKTLDLSVFKNGCEVPGPWFGHVKYLHFDVNYDLKPLGRAVESAGLVRRIRLGAGEVVLIRAQPYVQLVRKMLIEDPFFLLGGMPDIPIGVIPRDGVSWGRDGLRIDRSSDY